jgi:hypothetical protein
MEIRAAATPLRAEARTGCDENSIDWRSATVTSQGIREISAITSKLLGKCRPSTASEVLAPNAAATVTPTLAISCVGPLIAI